MSTSLFVYFVFLATLVTQSFGDDNTDVCSIRPEVQDVIHYMPAPENSFLAAVMQDTVTTFPSFYNSYPVISASRAQLMVQYKTLYELLANHSKSSFDFTAATRTSTVPGPDQKFQFFLSVDGIQMAFTTNAAGHLEGQQLLQQLGDHMQDVVRVEAAEHNLLIVKTSDSGEDHKLMVRSDNNTWSSYWYGEGDKYPTGIVQLQESVSEVTYLVLFQTVYTFYTLDKPVKRIDLDPSQRFYDNKRLISCPVNPCQDFKLDAAFFLEDQLTYYLISGLHVYQFDSTSGAQTSVMGLDSLGVSLNKRVDAAFTVFSGDKLLLFLFLNEMVMVVAVDKKSPDWSDPAIWLLATTPVTQVFGEDVRRVDAAVSIPSPSKNLVWLFLGRKYWHFAFSGASLTKDDMASKSFAPEKKGRISELLPKLPTPVHAAMAILPSQVPKARFFVDNWYYEGFLNGSEVSGPFLTQEHLFKCTDGNYSKDHSFRILNITSLSSFRSYMSHFQPVYVAESRDVNDIVLFSVTGFGILVVVISIGICCYMWRQSHKEKTRGFHAQKKKFKYDYD